MANRFVHAYNEVGIIGLVQKIFGFLVRKIQNIFLSIRFLITPAGEFTFLGHKLSYFRHTYNRSYDNERTIEIPIVDFFAKNYSQKDQVLEVGNVFSNYNYDLKRDILDKYDDALIVNFKQDIIDFNPSKKYDFIFGVSTFEHVGWDENIKDPNKIEMSLMNLKEKALAPKGLLITTFPLGYNPYLDELIDKKPHIFTELVFFKRTSKVNEWLQVNYADVKGAKFDKPFNNANAMVIGIIKA
jgi:hypothetical protein